MDFSILHENRIKYNITYLHIKKYNLLTVIKPTKPVKIYIFLFFILVLPLSSLDNHT